MLVFIESPSKIPKISKILKNYVIKASVGHIMDLPTDSLGFDDKFNATYIVKSDKKKIVAELKKCAKSSKVFYLATDPDREGERIAYDLQQCLKLKNAKRITFTEITENAILKAIQNPTEIDMDMVHSQMCRRMIDRLIGFKLSPIVNKEIQSNTDACLVGSAGRVQSIVTRLIYDREQEIKEFDKDKFCYKVSGLFEHQLDTILNKTFSTKDKCMTFFKDIQNRQFRIKNIKITTHIQNPPPPFITATIQQVSPFNVKMTTDLLQKMYQSGYITYIRTDSTYISDDALPDINDLITNDFGQECIENRSYGKKGKNAQEGHECLRHTKSERRTLTNNEQNKLYNIIWKRTIASQMKPAIIEKTEVIIEILGKQSGPASAAIVKYHFIGTTNRIKSPGYLLLYQKDEEKETKLNFKEGDFIKYKEIIGTQTFDTPPSRYTEPTLVKALKDKGIGRPSTYSSSITHVQDRKYIEKKDIDGFDKEYILIKMTYKDIVEKVKKSKVRNEKGKLVPTLLGIQITEFLLKNFSNIMEYEFTSLVEEQLDDIANGKKDWVSVVSSYYDILKPMLNKFNIMAMQGEEVGEYNGEKVFFRETKFGPAYIYKGVYYNTKTKLPFNEVVPLFEYPKEIGEYKNEKIILKRGAYGLYFNHGGKNHSVKKDKPTLEDCIASLTAKKALKTFKYGTGIISVMDGQYGPTICYKTKFYKVPKEIDINKITLNECKALINKDV